ncbi:hypothetical protein, partial [Neisseria mucosa]|uniref:hypothetical protein n=1 Tax=Neisseria mucosa TaxID=488 RepID=UPI000A6C5165
CRLIFLNLWCKQRDNFLHVNKGRLKTGFLVSDDLFHSSPLKSAIRHYLSVSGDGGILDMPKPMIYC